MLAAHLLGEPPALVVLLLELLQRERLAGSGLLCGQLALQCGALRFQRSQPRACVRLLGLLLRRQLRRLRTRRGSSQPDVPAELIVSSWQQDPSQMFIDLTDP